MSAWGKASILKTSSRRPPLNNIVSFSEVPMQNVVYLDWNATAPLRREAREAMGGWFHRQPVVGPC